VHKESVWKIISQTLKGGKIMKKITSLLIAIIMLISAISCAAAQERSFDDVKSDHFAYDAVQYFSGENVIEGIGDNKFAPDDFVTREQFAKMISIIYNKETFETKEQTFSDVTPDMWAHKYIEAVKEYLTGYYPEGGKAFFNPYGRAQREDVAYALVKISGLKEKNKIDLSVLEGFKDANEISMNLKEYVALAVSAGLMQGYENMLRPQDGITRAEVATLLFRAIKKPIDEKNPSSEKPDHEKDNSKFLSFEKETNNILKLSGYSADEIEGELSVEWDAARNEADFEAELKCRNGAWEYVECEIELVELDSIDEDGFTGYFNVKLDEKIRHEKIFGTVSVKGNILKLNTEEYDYDLKASFVPKVIEEKEPEGKKKEERPEAKKNVIYSKNITEFKIINTEGENIDVDDEERLSGLVELTFGDDAYETNLMAEITVDEKDKYLIKSTGVIRYKIIDDGVFVEMSYDVYKNDKLIIEDSGRSVTAKKGYDEIACAGRVNFETEKVVWLKGSLPKEPDYEPEIDIWADSDMIRYRVAVSDKESFSGDFKYTYKDAEGISKVDSKFEIDDKEYEIELVEEISKNDNEIIANFKVICNGEVVSESVKGKIINYNCEVGEFAEFVLDDNSIDIKMQSVSKTV